ncbi:hypothetical protein AYO44_05525 [Planctomycetaceae bacterium SCGC AG-212-F19]|nr:hypothetical protein AYO44_05525 [Planctomycetaceae bacterium SCGC AG-212-F19]
MRSAVGGTKANDPASFSAPTNVWLVILSVVLLVLLILASLALVFFGVLSYTDSYSHDADRWWGMVGMTVAPLLFLSGASALLFLVLRKPLAWSASMALLVLTLVGIGVLIAAGFGMLAEAKRRGGDWAALGYLGSLVFGIGYPALVGLLALGSGLCLWTMRRQHHAGTREVSHAS